MDQSSPNLRRKRDGQDDLKTDAKRRSRNITVAVVYKATQAIEKLLGIKVTPERTQRGQEMLDYMQTHQVVPALDEGFEALVQIDRGYDRIVWMSVDDDRLAYMDYPLSMMLCLKDDVSTYPLLRKVVCLVTVALSKEILDGDHFQFLVLCKMDQSVLLQAIANSECVKQLMNAVSKNKLRLFRCGFIRGRILAHLQHIHDKTDELIKRGLSDVFFLVETGVATWEQFFETKQARDELCDVLEHRASFDNDHAKTMFQVWRSL
jgi:hypothetical protein